MSIAFVSRINQFIVNGRARKNCVCAWDIIDTVRFDFSVKCVCLGYYCLIDAICCDVSLKCHVVSVL